MVFSRGELIALWTSGIIFAIVLLCVLYQLCSASVRSVIQNVRPLKRRKRLNAQEKKVNRILSNQNVREILQSRAQTAINSQINRKRQCSRSHLSLDSVESVPDLTDRVVRVSFAPAGDVQESAADQASETVRSPETDSASVTSVCVSVKSEGVVSNPPAYDTLSTHSKISLSDPPPDYATVSDSKQESV